MLCMCMSFMGSEAAADGGGGHGTDALPATVLVATGVYEDVGALAGDDRSCLRREAVSLDDDRGIAWIDVYGRKSCVPFFEFEEVSTATDFEEKAAASIAWMDFSALPYMQQNVDLPVYGYNVHAEYIRKPGFVRFRAVSSSAAASGAFPLGQGESAALLLPDENNTWRVFYFASVPQSDDNPRQECRGLKEQQ